MVKNGINTRRLSHTQSMEKRIKQKRILTKANSQTKLLPNAMAVETITQTITEKEMAFSALQNGDVKETDKGKGMFLSPQDAEEYRAYKRRKKVEEIMAAIAKSEASLLNGEDPQRVCERAIRLKQAAIKVPPSWLPQAKTYLGGSKVKIDCVIGGNGETLTKVKAYEMRVALKGNAKELTVLIAPSMLSQGRFQEIKKELKKLCRTARKTVVKVWVDSNYPFATLSKVARICCEVGVKYFCVPYFNGCERLRFDLVNGCQIEVSEVENLAEYRKLCESGVGRIVTRNIWEIYSEWIKEADKIKDEGAAILWTQEKTNAKMALELKTSPEKAMLKETPLTDNSPKPVILSDAPSTVSAINATNASETTTAPTKTPITPTAAIVEHVKQTTDNGKQQEAASEKMATDKKETPQKTVAEMPHARLEGSDLKFL